MINAARPSRGSIACVEQPVTLAPAGQSDHAAESGREGSFEDRVVHGTGGRLRGRRGAGPPRSGLGSGVWIGVGMLHPPIVPDPPQADGGHRRPGPLLGLRLHHRALLHDPERVAGRVAERGVDPVGALGRLLGELDAALAELLVGRAAVVAGEGLAVATEQERTLSRSVADA